MAAIWISSGDLEERGGEDDSSGSVTSSGNRKGRLIRHQGEKVQGRGFFALFNIGFYN